MGHGIWDMGHGIWDMGTWDKNFRIRDMDMEYVGRDKGCVIRKRNKGYRIL